LEVPVARLYRSYFVDLGRLADEIRAAGPASFILEVGCGEGSLTQEIAARFRGSRILGIDVSPRVGRLYRGDPAQVTFRQSTVERLAEASPPDFDLVVLADVLHHAAPPLRRSLLEGVRRVLRPRGLFVLKEWERRANFPHALAWLSDRFVTGDRVEFLRDSELRRLVEDVFGTGCVEKDVRIRPHSNNLALFVRQQS
jgi:2-polyprenyl-6-hydroxyphenyl methylase/3-demethylubiquinone-9 3-methyltransferase